MVVDIQIAPADEGAVRAHLQSLAAVRERAAAVYALGEAGRLDHFTLHPERLDAVADYVAALIRRDYAHPTDVPPHSRWRHFTVGGVDRVADLLARWPRDSPEAQREATRRVLDLFVVSVLLDAGAGDAWTYREAATGQVLRRSEGLAVASLDLFLSGAFSGSPGTDPCRVDGLGLQALTVETLRKGFQVTDENPLVGLDGRCTLLRRLGEALETQATYFAAPAGVAPRPGHLLDYLLTCAGNGSTTVALADLWTAVLQGFGGVWPPTRTLLNGRSLGDVWLCPSLPATAPADRLVPFHKLSQWLTYSLLEPLTALMGIEVTGLEALTGLPEYRNGGLFIDLGVLVYKDAPAGEEVPTLEVDDPAVVEWRALTVILLDLTAARVRTRFGLSERELPLAQVLEGGTWKAGREIAAERRPATRGPPLAIRSDGTVF
ncbi:hypothetical protein IWQ60_008701 [Tieghemiomyces parasiticus]|uniref:Uracil catabolism protein 4 n=1 Tax=Tieghemiomyces parasiticus TaxID=78921 RepID=A0A9W8A0G7_9FUNG|nr:hypothetical protein IWQ60_008701 [Tieghemiomyces parasiticus]